jgi:hypothetical protein
VCDTQSHLWCDVVGSSNVSSLLWHALYPQLGFTPLHWAAQKDDFASGDDHVGVAALLLDRGADVNASTEVSVLPATGVQQRRPVRMFKGLLCCSTPLSQVYKLVRVGGCSKGITTYTRCCAGRVTKGRREKVLLCNTI